MSRAESVPVVFRVWRGSDGGDVIALFPTLVENRGQVTSYMRIGQHGAADYQHVIRDTRPAAPAEYEPLARELTQIGYVLAVHRRRPRG
jgi:hypothetical protein